MEGVGAREPVGPEVVRAERVGGAAVGDEGPLAVGRDERRRSGRSAPRRRGVTRGVTPSARSDVDERAAGGVAPDRADQRAPRPEPAEPAGGVRRRAALDERDAARARRSRSAIGRVGREHDVEHQVAEDDDPRHGPPSGGAPDDAVGPGGAAEAVGVAAWPRW